MSSLDWYKSYKINSSPALASRCCDMLRENGINASLNSTVCIYYTCFHEVKLTHYVGYLASGRHDSTQVDVPQGYYMPANDCDVR